MDFRRRNAPNASVCDPGTTRGLSLHRPSGLLALILLESYSSSLTGSWEHLRFERNLRAWPVCAAVAGVEIE
jgi:hypothetical protein